MLLYQINRAVNSDKNAGRKNGGRIPTDINVQEFVSCLNLSDDEILNKFQLTLDGNHLTPEQARRFLSFVRQEMNRSECLKPADPFDGTN